MNSHPFKRLAKQKVIGIFSSITLHREKAQMAKSHFKDISLCFSTFHELKKHLGNPGKGYAWHHIVEQSQIEKRANFAPELIHNTNNIVRIPSGHNSIHSKISAFYSSKYNFTKGLTVRDWLASKDYAFQFDFGKKKLEEYGKLIRTDNKWIFKSH